MISAADYDHNVKDDDGVDHGNAYDGSFGDVAANVLCWWSERVCYYDGDGDDIGDGDEKPLQFSVGRDIESLLGPDFSSSPHLPSLWPGKPELPLPSPSSASTSSASTSSASTSSSSSR